VAVLITRLLEVVLSIVSLIMLFSFLGAGSGFAGFILEQYQSFLTALFSMAAGALAFGYLPNS
jgi:hypothetical protein